MSAMTDATQEKGKPTPKKTEERGQKRHVVGRVINDTASEGRAKKTITVEVVRRINLIKRMMAEGMTLEEIRGSFVGLKNQLCDVEQGFSTLLSELSRKAREHPHRRQMEGELGRAQREVRQAMRRIEKVGGRVATVRRELVQAS